MTRLSLGWCFHPIPSGEEVLCPLEFYGEGPQGVCCAFDPLEAGAATSSVAEGNVFDAWPRCLASYYIISCCALSCGFGGVSTLVACMS